MNPFFSFLKPSPPPDIPDMEGPERARALRSILWALMGLGALIVIVSLFIPGVGLFVRLALAVGCLYILCAAAFYLNSRRRTRLASILLVAGISILLTWLALTAGGIRANAAHGYVVLVAAAGLLLGEAALFVAAGSFALLSLGLVVIELTGYLPPDVVTRSPLFLWSGTLYILIAVACLQYLNTRMLRDRLLKQRKQEAMLSTILNAIPQSVFWKDRRGVYLGCNEMFAGATGLGKPEFVVGKTDLELPWPPTEAEGYRRDDLEVMNSNRPKLHIVEPLQRADGKRLWADTSKSPLVDPHGEVYGVVGILEDITDRIQVEQALQKSERLFRAVVENSHDGVVLLDINRRIKYISPSFARIAGYAPEEIEETFGPAYTHPDDRAFTEQRFRDALRAPGASISLEYRVRHKQGHWMWIEATASNLLDDPAVQAIVLNLRDITERKSAEDALQESMEQLHALSAELEHAREQERKSTAREVHDELGQILTAIRMGIERAGREGAMAHAAHGAETDSLLALVDQGILAVQRIAARLRPGVLDDLGLLAAMDWRVEEFQKQSGIACSLSLPETEPAIDEGRSTALFRIMGELLTNAARHAKASEVSVSLKETMEELIMSVKDNGIGIRLSDVGSPTALGFKGIRERLYPYGGRCIIPPAHERGTEIVIHLPKINPLRRNDHGPHPDHR